MSSPDQAILPSMFKGGLPVSFIASDGVAAKIVADTTVAQAGSATVPRLVGGATIIDFTAASTDTVARDLIIW